MAKLKEYEVFALAGCCGAAAFGGAYILSGLTLEIVLDPLLSPPGVPRLSYGQQFGMIMTPIAAAIGLVSGSAMVVIIRCQLLRGSALLAAAAMAGLALTAAIWRDQRNRYGFDPSEIGLYVPLFAMCVFVLTISICLTVFVFVICRSQSRHRLNVEES